ncbi:hypothetical protein BH18ACT13_BH18ACT13_08150 [soil metagenome]
MPFVRYTTKRAARRAQRTWLLGVAKFEIVARLLGGVPQGELASGACDVIAIAMGYLAVEAASAAEDPPRPDFTTSTRAKRRRLPIDRLGDSELERLSAQFAEASSYGAAYLAAFVRAVERSQMAEEVEATQAVELRVVEADAFAKRAAVAIWRASEQGLALANAFEADRDLRHAARTRFRGPEGDQLLATPYWEKLSSKAAQLFREAGVEPIALRADWDEVWAEDPVHSSVVTLRDAVASSSQLAQEIGNWGPESEKPETPSFWEAG